MAISKQELRDDLAALRQRAEAGERIAITLAGRVVAELGPVQRGQFVSASEARTVFAGLPPTCGLSAELDAASGAVVDPLAC